LSRLHSIQAVSRARGFVTVEEFDELLTGLIPDWGKCYPNNPNQRKYAGLHNCLGKGKGASVCQRFYTEYRNFLKEVVGEDMLPFEAMFYLALEQENYKGAETIRREWLKRLLVLKEGSYRLMFSQKFQDALGGMLMSQIEQQIDQLTSVVGLTDPMLIKLRKKLVIAMDKDDWDSAQKIQSIITARTNELRPQQPQVIVQGAPGYGGSNITVQQNMPSVQRHEVQMVPRYGVTDVVRAMNAMEGRTMTREEAGAAKMLDIILGR
jgi:hypothetical protein